MKKVPDFDIELSQATDYIMESPLAKRAFSDPPFPQYTNILRLLIQSVDRLADNCHMPEFTNHALPHICSIVRRASEWAVEDGWLYELSQQEIGYLLLALVIHDIGMLSQDAQDLPDEDKTSNMKGLADLANWVRRTHVIRLQGLVLRLLQDEFELDVQAQKGRDGDRAPEGNRISLKDHMMVVIGMAASHQCWEWDPSFLSNTGSIKKLQLDEERIAAMNAVIAVCDLLDEDSNRCDTITLIKYRHGTMENLAHWIRHALTVEVDGVRNHKVTVTFRKLLPSEGRHEKIYRALRNHYRLVKLYNRRLEKINAKIDHVIFDPADGIPERTDEISEELSGVWEKLPEFKGHIVEQLLSTFMQEALNKDHGDAQMRCRLDRLGLETLDLTAEQLFLETPTICFSEEKILFVKKDFQEILQYIKEQADTAYLDGNIGKLRHLCITALKYWDTPVSLNKIYWLFSYIIVFQKYGNEAEHFSYEYTNSLQPDAFRQESGKLIVEGEYQPLFDVLLLLQRIAIGEQWYDKYLNRIQSGDYAHLQNDTGTQLLLETVVGLLWYYDPHGTVWLQAAGYLCGHLPHELGKKFSDYVEQMEKLHRILYAAGKEEMEELRRKCTHPMEKAWVDFWNDDWQAQELNIPELCRLGNYDRDYMEPIQGYLNLIRDNIQIQHWQMEEERQNAEKAQPISGIDSNETIAKNISSEGKEQKEEAEPDGMGMEASEDISDDGELEAFRERERHVGIYRYNRIILEQPMAVFWEQRKLVIESMIGECRKQKQDSQQQRLQLIRLIALHTLEALRYWDLWQYISIIRSQTELEFLNGVYLDRYGKYCGDISALRNCFINYIRGLDPKKLTKEEKELAAKLLMKHGREELDRIVYFITKQSIPLQWAGALNIVDTFARYFSASQRKSLLGWLVQYDAFYKKQNRYYDSTQYQFLRLWCPDMEEEDWARSKPMIDDIFSRQTALMSNSKLAEAVFSYAPQEYCMEYIGKIKEYPDNRQKSYELYSALITMSHRKDVTSDGRSAATKFLEIVDGLVEDISRRIEETAAEAETEDMENIGRPSREDFIQMKLRYIELRKLVVISGLDQLETVDLDMIRQSLDKLEAAIEERGNLKGYDSTFMTPLRDTFINKNWHVAEETELQEIIDRIFSIMEQQKETISVRFFCDLCYLLMDVQRCCSSSICAYINRIVISDLVREDFFSLQKQSLKEGGEQDWDGPYETFRLDMGSGNQYESIVTLLLVNGMTSLKQEEQMTAIKFVTQALQLDEPVIYNYAAVFYSYFFLVSGEDSQEQEVIRSLAWGGLQFILGRLAAERRLGSWTGEGEIHDWVQQAVDAMVNSNKWFGEKGFLTYARENREYGEWIVAAALRCDFAGAS